MPDTTPTPAEVTQAALIPAALPAEGVALLGTFTKKSGATSLVRLPDGQVQPVTSGTEIGELVVAAITDAEIILAHRDGQTSRLTIPTG